MKNVIGLVVVVVLAPTLLNAEVLLKEDFEGGQYRAFRLSHTNGGDIADIKVHHLGVSDERAAGGKRSFKIDLTIPKGDDVHCVIPVDFPFTKTHDLKVEGKIFAKGAEVRLGFYYRIPAVRLSDLVYRGKTPKDISSAWNSRLTCEPRLSESALPTYMHALVVYIRPKPGAQFWRFSDTRVVVYVDDLTVTAIPRGVSQPKVETIETVDGYKIIPVKAITDEKVLSSSPVIPKSMKLEALELTAAGDEYESASFVILAGKELQDVRITMPPFSKGGDTISSIDMWAIKCWYQPRPYDILYGLIAPMLTPELLLHDDELVTVDVKSKKQHLRVTTSQGKKEYFDIMGPNSALKQEYLLEDAPSLLPVTIKRLEPKQFWLTVYVPPDAPPGDYKSTLRIAPKNARPRTLPVTLKVLPFRLPPPSLEYSHFYRAGLKDDNIPLISSELKTKEQLAAEFRDMKAHGVTNPAVRDMGNLQGYLTVRNAVGMSRDRLFFQRGPHSSNNDGLRREMAMFKKFGFKDVYLYGIDEATGKRLSRQRPDWQRARRLGFKIFASGYSRDYQGEGNVGFFSLVGDILDAPILAGPARPDLAAKVKANGFRIYMYANPQYGLPIPETYRRNFGLSLWKAGYSGAMDYAYQHGLKGHMWNDMALGIYDRMTYPTSSGVVVTMAWEGFREGVDDVRYVTLLENLLNEVLRNPAASDEAWRRAADIRMWLDVVDLTGDLDVVRRELYQRILVLRDVLGSSQVEK